MIRKRRSLSSARKGKEPLHARRVAAPVRRRGGKVVRSREHEEPALSAAATRGTDKQELILAHAASRQSRSVSASLRTWVFIGVVLSAVVVCVGWFMTFGVSLRSGESSGGGLLDILRGRSEQLREELREPTEGAKAALEAFEARRAAQEAALEKVAEEIRGGQVSSTEGVVHSTSTYATSTGP